ncbi:uncharacterized protein BO88DRAFT_430201 [Aspergillus vadensis CBS 113365]|uniref:Uncharacterized protein n=1 Tax=Aspergillus vadensis (strain CBS 113365 / IMI 142717 / IBT 24658) TaxID=1448311 RepID=A0A319AWD0_ASPVC|nr:hypothetical protein BO88DRAFT_430201 [Aspergillus vadensis CBS 113365]PYH63671.1 hypothetical protein BO88DRAFT_430201 [Aspergillus vadensis CBS 113365]
MSTPESPYFFPVPSVVLVGIFHGYFISKALGTVILSILMNSTVIIFSGKFFIQEYIIILIFNSTGFALATASITDSVILNTASFTGSLFTILQSAVIGGAVIGVFIIALNISIIMVGSVAIRIQWNYFKTVPRMGYNIKNTSKTGYCNSDQPDNGFNYRVKKEWVKLL